MKFVQFGVGNHNNTSLNPSWHVYSERVAENSKYKMFVVIKSASLGTVVGALSGAIGNDAATLYANATIPAASYKFHVTNAKDELLFSFTASSGAMACCGVWCVGTPWLLSGRALPEKERRAVVNLGLDGALRYLAKSAFIQADYAQWRHIKALWDGDIISMDMSPINRNSGNPIDIFAFVAKNNELVPNDQAVKKDAKAAGG